MRDRLAGVEPPERPVRRQVGRHLGSRGHLRVHVGVGDDESVEVHHQRQQHPGVLGYPERLDDGVDGLLVAGDVNLEPACVALAYRVLVVAPDVPARAQRAVDVGHHHGHADARGVVEHLVHIGKPVRGGGGEGPDPSAP